MKLWYFAWNGVVSGAFLAIIFIPAINPNEEQAF
jgi:hypothetical protein